MEYDCTKDMYIRLARKCFDIDNEAFGAVLQLLPEHQWKGDSGVLLAWSGTYRIRILD